MENITLNVCLTIDLIYEPTGCMVHLGPEHMRFIYQVCTVLLNTPMVVFYVIGVHLSELIPKIKFVNYLLKGRGFRQLNAGIDIFCKCEGTLIKVDAFSLNMTR